MKYFFLLLICIPFITDAQTRRIPDGGGGYRPTNSLCISPEERAILVERSQQALKELKEKETGMIQTQTAPVSFMWPIANDSASPYPNIYAISNYVDENENYPNEVLDYECGSRSYDLESGYNHAGTDIYVWPHSWYVMDQNLAAVVAADAGTLYAKDEYNNDRTCGWDPDRVVGRWNAVYIKHSDGTISWYGHLKEGSVTTRGVGSKIAKGEYLGLVGSAGFSSGPHLHFEVHTSADSVIDPWEGDCNVRGNNSLWTEQKPYVEPKINGIDVHSSEPLFGDCSTTIDEFYSIDTLPLGRTYYFTLFMSDEPNDTLTSLSLIQPDGFPYDSWTHYSILTDYYSSTWWYWQKTLPVGVQEGTWTFQATFQGKTVVRPFVVKAGAPLPPKPVKLLSPPDDSVTSTRNVTFEWSSSTRAKSYRFQIGTHSRYLTGIYRDTIITEPQVLINNIPTTKEYFWRVMPLNGTAKSQWSPTWSLKTRQPSSVEKVSEDKNIRIFPNPSSSYIMIESDNVHTATLEITDVLGKSMMKLTNVHLSSEPHRIDTKDIPAGAYYLTIKSADINITRSFVKQ